MSQQTIHFIYPSDPLKTKQPDAIYAEESVRIQESGFATSVFSFEEFQSGTLRPFPALQQNALIIYRGWMLSGGEYERLVAEIESAGAKPFTAANTYLAAHHLPRWYPLVTEFTPETRIFPADADLAAELRALNWPGYFIKDYVKSLKTSIGSIILSPDQAAIVGEEMRRFRGTIEGGFCVRRLENFQSGTEKRYFVLKGSPYSMDGEIPDIVNECARRIPSQFFSVDIARNENGQLRLVELGDGQVSELTGWTAERFAGLFREKFGIGA